MKFNQRLNQRREQDRQEYYKIVGVSKEALIREYVDRYGTDDSMSLEEFETRMRELTRHEYWGLNPHWQTVADHEAARGHFTWGDGPGKLNKENRHRLAQLRKKFHNSFVVHQRY